MMRRSVHGAPPSAADRDQYRDSAYEFYQDDDEEEPSGGSTAVSHGHGDDVGGGDRGVNQSGSSEYQNDDGDESEEDVDADDDEDQPNGTEAPLAEGNGNELRTTGSYDRAENLGSAEDSRMYQQSVPMGQRYSQFYRDDEDAAGRSDRGARSDRASAGQSRAYSDQGESLLRSENNKHYDEEDDEEDVPFYRTPCGMIIILWVIIGLLACIIALAITRPWERTPPETAEQDFRE